MRGMEEQLYLQMMAGRAGGLFGAGNWLELAMFLALLGLVIFRPERIQSTTLFRWACTLFALSICLPPLATFLVRMAISPMQPNPWGSGAEGGFVLIIPSVAQPLLFGFSLFCLFAAVIPTPNRPASPVASSPPKHPLD